MRAESEVASELKQTAGELFGVIRQAEKACQLSREAIDADFADRRKNQDAYHAEVAEKARLQFDESIRRELAKLEPPSLKSQLKWDDPDLRNHLNPTNGGLESCALRFGEFTVAKDGSGEPIPLILEVLNQTRIVLTSDAGGRARALSAFQSLILRHLVSVAPGKLLLRLFDAKEHGRSFSGFIQSLPKDISGGKAGFMMRELDGILDELDKRIATVSQQYLKPATPTLWAFNQTTAGDVEPYYLFALDNFPAGIDEGRANRVLRIAEYGPAAGVFTVLYASRDDELQDLKNGETFWDNCIHLEVLKAGTRIWENGQALECPVEADLYPEPELGEKLLALIGATQKKASSEKESFAVEPADRWWKGDSLTGIQVSIGRTKNGESVNLCLNEETFTGALVAGSSGSGKSNLLHVIVTRLMTEYGPADLNLYLLDLKGIEFNLYEQYHCPHVKMILSDMSQKLGLGVLREFQGILQQRKKLFSAQRRQKLSDYNQVPGVARLPRIVAVIDEFQKLFVGDVVMAREAEEIISNLLRQGRSYGIHLIMASQNLSAQTTPRDIKTMFQIRIVLKFRSPSDYAIVLESDFNAANILKERGQALYDTGSGEPPFVLIPHLPGEELIGTLEQMSKLTLQKGNAPRDLVFLDGEEASDIKRNAALATLVARGAKVDGDVELWIGDAFSLRGRASLVLRRQAASNVLVVCQERHFQDALAMISVALLAHLAHSPGNNCYIFSAKSRKADEAMLLNELAKEFPDRVIIVGDGDSAVLERLAARVKSGVDSEAASTLLVFAGLQRLGNLRMEFQNLFSRLTPTKGSAPVAGPGDSIRLILEDGSRFGIHTLVVTDSLSSLDRQVPNRFNLRVGFRLTDTESHLVIGTKDAEGLDDGFAVLVDKGEASEPQEFRPYVQIDPLWFNGQLSTLKARGAQ